jgi:hypothetical protein
LDQAAHGCGTRDGRAARRTLDNLFAHSFCHPDIVEVSGNDTFSDQGFLERLHRTSSVLVDALLCRKAGFVGSFINLRWPCTRQAARPQRQHQSQYCQQL